MKTYSHGGLGWFGVRIFREVHQQRKAVHRHLHPHWSYCKKNPKKTKTKRWHYKKKILGLNYCLFKMLKNTWNSRTHLTHNIEYIPGDIGQEIRHTLDRSPLHRVTNNQLISPLYDSLANLSFVCPAFRSSYLKQTLISLFSSPFLQPPSVWRETIIH